MNLDLDKLKSLSESVTSNSTLIGKNGAKDILDMIDDLALYKES